MNTYVHREFMAKKLRAEEFFKGITWEDISNLLKGIALLSSIIGQLNAPSCPQCNRKQLFVGVGYLCVNRAIFPQRGYPYLDGRN